MDSWDGASLLRSVRPVAAPSNHPSCAVFASHRTTNRPSILHHNCIHLWTRVLNSSLTIRWEPLETAAPPNQWRYFDPGNE